MAIYELKCFGTGPGAGNAALVIIDGPASAGERQAFAQSANKSACVFVDGGTLDSLDYYYPHARSPLCLHATLAAARVLLGDSPGPLPVRTAMGGQQLLLTSNGTAIFASLAPQAVPDVALPADLAERLLAAPGLAIVSPPAVASVGSAKLLVEVAGSAALHALRPDLAAIADWGKANGVNGIYAWCRRSDGAFEGRNFNHLDPAGEDSATGVAAGALTVHLGRSLELYQGAQLGQPCLLRTGLDGGQVLIGGAAEYV
ncbi:phenazine biosynthesis protein PhzF family [Duganella sp. CF458]|uniref:PhzF family phenazine biosynthesis protein n=1 Tax=Duganella sp. CF458 TaxID=1884368 RepID=UPI0008E62FC7|nr:PhzF family phenazine biosynthesis protein [Duganella sp. CF458]SFG30911.1 phenazine biosynthesis protein PhzF family [Duganella sp. CF458]